MFFSWLDWVLERRTTEGKCLSHHTCVQGTCHQCDLSHLDHLGMSGVFTVKLLSFSLSMLCPSEGSQLTPKGRDAESFSTLRVEHLHKLFWILLPRFVFSLPE